MSTIAIVFALPLLFLLLIPLISTTFFQCRNKKRAAPEAGGSWPLLGHIHLLVREPPHITLSKMADRYGPIFTIKLGIRRALVVSSWEAAKECLTINDKAFASRPITMATEICCYNQAILPLSPYGPYWRNMRKTVKLELLSKHRVEKLKHVRESEIKVSIQELYQLWKQNKHSSDNVLVEMKEWFNNITLNVILKAVVGKRISSFGKDSESMRWKKVLKRFFEACGKFVIADTLPFLRWFDIGGDERFMKKTSEGLDEVVEAWLQEHKQKRCALGDDGQFKAEEEDFMDVLLSISNYIDDVDEYDVDTIIKATCLGLILAASESSSNALIWALSLLLNNRDVLKKARQEIESINVAKDKLLDEDDLQNLVYLPAIIKETLRLYPSGPLGLPHESLEDCTINGYHVPTGTQLFLNMYKIHRDPRVWSDPLEFQPERFLGSYSNVDVRGQHFELIPFGCGRRVCPGISFAMRVMQLTLANLLHGFEIATPLDEPVDMREDTNLSYVKAAPLQVYISPRLPASCYESKS